MVNPRSTVSSSPAAASKRGASGGGKLRESAGQAAKAKAGTTKTLKTAIKPKTGKLKPEIIVSANAKATALSYLAVYRASPLERIDMIRRGVPASEVKRMFADLAIGQGAGVKALNLSTATLNRKAQQGHALSTDESERVVGFAKLVGQLEAMIEDSGDPVNFDARAWMARWLTEPLPAFGGVRPADLIDTMEGQELVSTALAMIQSGAYA